VGEANWQLFIDRTINEWNRRIEDKEDTIEALDSAISLLFQTHFELGTASRASECMNKMPVAFDLD